MQTTDNISLTNRILKSVIAAGYREFIVCAGARNMPLLAALQTAHGVQIRYHFDERGAAFFALARTRAGYRTAVIVTSGTAAAELLPATIEAHYTATPLLLITADRPRRFRGTAAPQSMEQVGLFGPYTCWSADIEGDEPLPELPITPRAPLHLNLCLEEPSAGSYPPLELPHHQQSTPPAPNINRAHTTTMLTQLASATSPIVICGEITPQQVPAVKRFLKALRAPIVAESLSQLREDQDLSPFILQLPPCVLPRVRADLVIRIGSVPTTSFWRDLERSPSWQKVPVLSLADPLFSGLARESTTLPLGEVDLTCSPPSFSSWNGKLQELDHRGRAHLSALLQKYPRSEAALVHAFSALPSPQALVYLGNSLPIREWDLTAHFDRRYGRIAANRGQNGIDGQIASFLGWSLEYSESWALVGDLTALYDLPSLSLVNLCHSTQISLAVINNNGGRIFERLPFFTQQFPTDEGSRGVINTHAFSFQKIAEGFGWDYEKITDAASMTRRQLTRPSLLEILPNAKESASFWRDLEQLYAAR